MPIRSEIARRSQWADLFKQPTLFQRWSRPVTNGTRRRGLLPRCCTPWDHQANPENQKTVVAHIKWADTSHRLHNCSDQSPSAAKRALLLHRSEIQKLGRTP